MDIYVAEKLFVSLQAKEIASSKKFALNFNHPQSGKNKKYMLCQ